MIVIPIQLINYISSATSLQRTSDSEHQVAVIRIGFVDNLAISSTAENDFFSFSESNGKSLIRGTDYAIEVFPLPVLRSSDHYCKKKIIYLVVDLSGLDTPCQPIIKIMCI
jgi:hypothetical protein